VDSHRQPYEIISLVYDRWVKHLNYERMMTFLHAEVPHDRRTDGIDLCCGTATLSIMLAARGTHVVGLDASSAMLDVARGKAAESSLTDRLDFRCCDIVNNSWSQAPVDFICCTADSMNYFDAAKLAAVLSRAHEALRPGGKFIFDMNSEFKLREIFANTTYAEAFDEFAYIWRNNLDLAERNVTFHIELFIRESDEHYRRYREQHIQYFFASDEVVAALERAGFHRIRVRDDYRDQATTERTERLTFVAEKETT
jgi:SAM-dependent methyltransferase